MLDPLAITALLLNTGIIVLGVILYRKLPWEMQIIHLYFVTDIAFSLIGIYFAKHQLNNIWTIHLQMPVEYSLLAYGCSFWLGSRRLEKITRISIPFYVILWLFIFSFFEKYYNFSTYNKPLESFLLIVIAIIVLYRAGNDEENLVLTQSRFWISSGMILYFSGAFIIFTFGDYIMKLSPETLDVAWSIHNIVGLIAYLFYFIGFACKIRFQKSGGY